jgi:thioredoxin reductase
VSDDDATREVIIVGAGPAGLSAALLLGRCRRRVLVVDAGEPRNQPSRALHGFLGRDGSPPGELLAAGRAELRAYPSVELRHGRVLDARREDGGFEVELEGGGRARARKLLLATGIVDRLPAIPGLSPLFGTTVLHCPYCDAWEVRDRRFGVYSEGSSGTRLALLMSQWTRDVILFGDGAHAPDPHERELLARRGIAWRAGPIVRVEAEDGRLARVVVAGGEAVARDVLFFHAGKWPRSHLAERLGARVSAEGGVATGELEETCVPGLYVAGDASYDVLLAIVAAAEGAKAAFAINRELTQDQLF